MNYTSRMAALLGQMHRQRNGAVAASMRFYGVSCGLNYGVSLPTVRQIARAETPDHDFARYLFLQEVRELRLAALHIARPDALGAGEFAAWADGIVNSEIAQEAAFVLLSPASVLPELFRRWIAGANPLLQSAVLLAAARSPLADMGWIEPALEAVRRCALVEGVAECAECAECAESAECATSVAENQPGGVFKVSAAAAHLVAQGVVALLVALGSRNEENRQAVLRAAGSLGKLPTEDFIHEELAWQLEV